MRKFFFTSFLMVIGIVSNAHASVKCLGPESAGKKIVFFHGKQWKTTPAKIQELDVLQKISTDHKVRIAVVTSEDVDSDGLIYWDRQTLIKAQKSFSIALAKASACWRSRGASQEIVLMGFSSGGYLLNYLFQNCALNSFKTIISVEASGKMDRRKKCSNREGTLNLLVGRQEGWSFEEAKSYADWMKQDSKVEFIPFDGNHEFLLKPVQNVIRRTLK